MFTVYSSENERGNSPIYTDWHRCCKAIFFTPDVVFSPNPLTFSLGQGVKLYSLTFSTSSWPCAAGGPYTGFCYLIHSYIDLINCLLLFGIHLTSEWHFVSWMCFTAIESHCMTTECKVLVRPPEATWGSVACPSTPLSNIWTRGNRGSNRQPQGNGTTSQPLSHGFSDNLSVCKPSHTRESLQF